MADVYGNPYLPSFIRSQPKVTDPAMFPTAPTIATKMSAIQSVSGFEGARQYARNLTNGSSEIISDSSPNLARIYVVAVNQSGQPLVQGFDLTPVEEPKPVTIDDLNNKMNLLIERLDQIEKEKVKKNDESDLIVTAEPAVVRIEPNAVPVDSKVIQGSDVGSAAYGSV